MSNTSSAPRFRPAEFCEAAAALLGPRGFTTDGELISPWLTDWRGRFTGRALAMASPADTAELCALVRLAVAHGVAIVPQGGNSGMAGGATPGTSGSELLLSTRRMNTIGVVDCESGQVTCGAGVVLQNLHEAAAAAGMRFALSLGGKGSATVGGLVSTNAGGTQVLRHGVMRAAVLGLEVVLADGSIYSALTPLKKDNRGFDLKQMFIGSEGTLGIITAATLRVVPAVAERRVVWAGLPSLQAARALLLHCQNAMGGAIEGFEVQPAEALDAVLAFLPNARAPLAGTHAWNALIEVVAEAGGAATLGDKVEAMLAAAFEGGLIEDAAIAASEAQAEAFWALREMVAPAERARVPAVQHDISVPVAAMPDFVDAASEAIPRQFAGTSVVAFGHLGDGNIHFHVLAPEGVTHAGAVAWEKEQGKAITRAVDDMVAAWGGSISAEHGIGQLKRGELERLTDPVALALMARVKHALDPAGLLNPGKLVG